MYVQDLQWAALSESLEDTRRFADVADAMVFATCERAMRQINHTLERLAHVWRVSVWKASPLICLDI